MEPLTGGRSGALLFSVEADGQSYVVRQMGVQNRIPGSSDREQTCMHLAAELGLAPRIVRGWPEQGIVLMEKVAGHPIGRGTPRETDPLGRLAAVLRRLHGGPAFPVGPTMAERLAQLESFGVPLPPLLGDSIRAALPQLEGTSAPCHLDLNPSNILATPERIYLVDWEIAAQSEPFLDLAQLGVWVCRGDRERDELLALYLERPPDAREQRRMQLARVLALSFYALGFCLVCARMGVAPLSEGPGLEEVFGKMAASGQAFAPEEMAGAFIAEVAQLQP